MFKKLLSLRVLRKYLPKDSLIVENFTPQKEPINIRSPNLCVTGECLCIANKGFLMSNVHDEKTPRIVKVFHKSDLEKLEIVMQLHGTTRTVFRPKDEALAQSLERIKTNIKNANAKLQKKQLKKLKKENKQDEIKNPIESEMSPTAELFNAAGDKIDKEMKVTDAWEQGRTLKICDLTYYVVCNPPKVESLKLLASPIVGMPIYPQIQFKMASLEHSKFLWYKGLPHNSGMEENSMDIDGEKDMVNPSSKRQKLADAPGKESSTSETDKEKEWILIGKDKVYTATKEDVGFCLRLTVIPGNEKYPHDIKDELHPHYAEEVATMTEGVVQPGPEKCIFEERQLLTKERCKKGSFRFVSYNILADVYASTEYAKDFLFPYCPAEAIDIGYRQQLIAKELSGYNADILCLQEVDRFVFESQLMPAMSIEGFAGAFAAKDGIKEGLALFYRKERFRLVMVDNIILRKAIKEERNKDLWNNINQKEEFVKGFLSRPTCLLVALLQSVDDPTKHILVGNNHFYWHPRGCQVRIIQMEVVLREMRHLHEKYTESGTEGDAKCDITCIVTGDLNSHPHSGAVQLLCQGFVPSNHADWYSMGKPEVLHNMDIRNPTKFESACGYPKYTNFVTGFLGCLDYIFIDPRHLSVERVIPLPSQDDVIKFSALPNVTSPSDHIAQVVDLSWKNTDCVDSDSPMITSTSPPP